MDTEVQVANVPPKARIWSAAGNIGGYLWHLLQMVLAMEAGMMVYHMLIVPLLRQTAYAALTDAYPLIGYWGMVVSMVLGMLALMWYQKATRRYCAEMTAAMVAPVAALTVLVLCSLIPGHILYGLGDPVMILAMAAYMMYRPHAHAHGDHTHDTQEQGCH